MNRGELRHKIEIWEYYETTTTNELGEKQRLKRKTAETFAKIESRIGSLLSGSRPADTVVQKTTMKITVIYKNLPSILPKKNFLKHGNIRYEIDYTIDTDETGVWLEIFCHEDK